MADQDRLDAPGFLGSQVLANGLEGFPGRRIALAWSARPGEDKREIARRLLDRMTGWIFPEITDRQPEVLQDSFGRPYLSGSEPGGPGISFSSGGGRLWAALIDKGHIGVDVTSAAEFEEPYPYDRVFQLEEMAAARSTCRGSRAAAAALLWSVKEAAVKALGCGFHLMDPLDLTVLFYAVASKSVVCGLQGLSGIQTLSIRTAWGWLSLAASRHGLHFPMPGDEP